MISFICVMFFQGEIEGSKLYKDLLKKAKNQFTENFAGENRLVNNFYMAQSWGTSV